MKNHQVKVKKLLLLWLIVAISSLMAGVYGIINDQISFSISPEYYYQYKFLQFGFAEDKQLVLPLKPRLLVAVVGFLSTWWLGLGIGLVFALAGLVYPTPYLMFKKSMDRLIFTAIVTLVFGVAGLVYGRLFASSLPPHWGIQKNIIDVSSFTTVGYMHNFSYVGAFIGMALGLLHNFKPYLLKKRGS